MHWIHDWLVFTNSLSLADRIMVYIATILGLCAAFTIIKALFRHAFKLAFIVFVVVLVLGFCFKIWLF